MIAGDLLGERARLTPGKQALVEVSSGRRFTYADLNRRAAHMAHLWTAECGLSPGDRIGILAENRVEYVDAFFAAGKSGVVLVPLSTRLTAAELAALIDDAGLRVVLYSRRWAQLKEQVEGSMSWVDLDTLDLDREIDFVPHPCAPEDLWCLLYTSGTTGKPKGVMLPHRMVIWNGYNTVASWQLRDSRQGLCCPLPHRLQAAICGYSP